jgi:predicted nucleic acid-binding protein
LSLVLDSSFLLSLYVRDTHTDDAAERFSGSVLAFLTPLNRAEVAHAIRCYVFRQAILPLEADAAWARFEEDRKNRIWAEVVLPLATWDTAIDLAHRFGPTLGIRTLDSLHVACALELHAEQFWSFDARQLRLAEAVGLTTAN